ncbi:transposase [Cryptosporangium phraense]|uniref:Transposase n=1 Tax=Cryptosporangium phraense TaxID=2593070 RepID=A0A545AXG9_9ACTN|nr:transposase [Cryptosporangium phraense]
MTRKHGLCSSLGAARWCCRRRGPTTRTAVVPAAGRPGPAGRGLLPHESDDAPSRAAVRDQTGRRAPHHRPARAALTGGPPALTRDGLIVDGTLIPVRDQAITARSKNYRYSVNVQAVIDADTQLVVSCGDPEAGSRNDCTVYEDSGAAWTTRDATVIAYRGPRCTGVVIPHRRNRDKTPMPD